MQRFLCGNYETVFQEAQAQPTDKWRMLKPKWPPSWDSHFTANGSRRMARKTGCLQCTEICPIS